MTQKIIESAEASRYGISGVTLEVLGEAAGCWHAMADYRQQRRRCKRYTYGDQWGDLIEVDGRVLSEQEYIRQQGNIPLKNNLIRRLVRNVVGVWRSNQPALKWPLPEIDGARRRRLQASLRRNAAEGELTELYARCLEEFLISGLAVVRKSMRRAPWPGGKSEPFTESVQPDAFFLDASATDPRGHDAAMVGMLHDLDFASLATAFGSTEGDFDTLAAIYGVDPSRPSEPGAGVAKDAFHSPASASRCRVVEVWRRETVTSLWAHDPEAGRLFALAEGGRALAETANEKRRSQRRPVLKLYRKPRKVWKYYFLSPQGHCLASGVSSLPDAGHPFVWRAYPFIDGEIHSFVADIIDQQRYTNRLISLYDWIMRSSAKGVLLFPEECLPPGVDIDDISDEWSRFNGVILFRPRPSSPLPQQISSNATNIGITELLNIQLKMMEDVSGVNGALQGKLANNSVSGTLFDRQTRNALTAITDILDTFNSFVAGSTRRDALSLALGSAS